MLHTRQRSTTTTTMVQVAASSFPQRRRTPSFSSSLLDAIYHSIDESKSHLDQHQQLGITMATPYTTATTTKHNHHGGVERRTIKERMDLRRAVMLEDWIDKHTSSSSSSSSSSETDTSTYNKQHKRREGGGGGGGSFARTKLRAMKIYGELNQRVKQPISPGTGSRIASFLSSIFSSENVKKAKMCYVGAVEDVSFDHHSSSSSKSKSPPCFSSSSASSFSTRSCMMSNKTPPPPPSSKGKTSNNNNKNGGVKRSVRFYPVSVILGEDSQPCGHKCIYENDPKKNNNSTENDDDDDDDDGMSCSSSDLFELDHLIGSSAAGIRFNEELPVYETTNLETNKAIANALRF
ncbi:protein BIG GRAIN 1-like C [Arachis ipaensis]|uniref:Protein BIG GRAIN 1-like B n=1 Tax=Arachis hypogaea TaxID=3818 RepID=A0A444WNK8_ARAHY|nr:protein BIG GRAIN 1-like C [Arachis ipaensis]XP_025630906.1 protein BIG GRAIN 1-like C [Arachis hypogaea]QHO22060.1 Protein BIG GRAIN 1-like C [Arachis hypogaea]RYQ78832.1 hypothetical protein Ahy_Scaffold9g108581 [Arachis hypogaea]